MHPEKNDPFQTKGPRLNKQLRISVLFGCFITQQRSSPAYQPTSATLAFLSTEELRSLGPHTRIRPWSVPFFVNARSVIPDSLII